MTTINHTPIATGAAANAAIINAPLSELDTKMGAAKTSGHIIYADASGNLAGTATFYRVPASGNIVIGDTTPSDITGATLQVAGGIVVSDGAGKSLGEVSASFNRRLSTLNATVDFSGPSSAMSVQNAPSYAAVPSSNTLTIATCTPTNSSYYPMLIIDGIASAGSNAEAFRVVMSRYIGTSSLTTFTSVGCPRGSAFLAAGDFTVTDDGTVVSFIYTNNEAATVYFYADLKLISR